MTNDSTKSLSSLKEQKEELKKNFRHTKVVKKNKVEVKRLDTYFKSINFNNKNFFLKIDTQGNDLETLIGLGNYINNTSYVKIEFPCIKLYKIEYDHWDILEFLRKNNFKPVFFENISRNNYGELIEYDAFFEKI